MLSRDEAEQAADGLMKPSADRLAERKERLEQRRRAAARPFSFLVPSAVAAAATAFSLVYVEVQPLVAVMFGASIGWSLSGLFNRK